jgi:hypothetical protein
MKRIDKLLKSADNALIHCKLVNITTTTISDDTYDGYLAGFGPAVITSGLLQTLATYVADVNRKHVLNAIAEVSAIDGQNTGETLLKHCLKQENKRNINVWRNQIIDASIALKMMIRTYNPAKKNAKP